MADMKAKAQSNTPRAAHGRGEGRSPRMGGRGGRDAYHHGDLRNALIGAATDLAREGGPEAVVLRAAARRVGVSPTAAYRHFAGQAELLRAVKELSQERLARSMEARGARAARGSGPQVAEARMRALGHGYLAFALAERGLYRVAFCRDALSGTPMKTAGAGQAPCTPAEDGSWELRPFALLVQVLDDLAESGGMPAERRAGAELTAWAAVHGLAMLCLDGPLAGAPPEEIHAVAERAFDVLIAGLTAPPVSSAR